MLREPLGMRLTVRDRLFLKLFCLLCVADASGIAPQQLGDPSATCKGACAVGSATVASIRIAHESRARQCLSSCENSQTAFAAEFYRW